MQKHRDVLQQASRLAVAVALCIAAMLAVYALTGHFTNAELLGALIGFVVCLFFFVFVVFKSIGWTSPGGSSEPPGFFCARFRRQPDLRTQE